MPFPGVKLTKVEGDEQLASYRKPRSVEFRDSLPKNPNGKVLRNKEEVLERVKKRVH
jgi:acyl-CoA synthetase (AMP-forming)/AMP-acid ligase II